MERLEFMFFMTIQKHPRIGASHISLYCALLKLAKDENDLVYFMSFELMKTAKICGLATYHKNIRELNDFGYIRYLPSFNHRKKSKVYL